MIDRTAFSNKIHQDSTLQDIINYIESIPEIFFAKQTINHSDTGRCCAIGWLNVGLYGKPDYLDLQGNDILKSSSYPNYSVSITTYSSVAILLSKFGLDIRTIVVVNNHSKNPKAAVLDLLKTKLQYAS